MMGNLPSERKEYKRSEKKKERREKETLKIGGMKKVSQVFIFIFI